jgi:hypothetical protein
VASGLTPFCLPARDRDRDVAQFLVEHGALTDFNGGGSNNRLRPLIIAPKYCQLCFLAWLLTSPEVNTNAATLARRTPLMTVIQVESTEIAFMLISDHRVDINAARPDGRNALC